MSDDIKISCMFIATSLITEDLYSRRIALIIAALWLVGHLIKTRGGKNNDKHTTHAK